MAKIIKTIKRYLAERQEAAREIQLKRMRSKRKLHRIIGTVQKMELPAEIRGQLDALSPYTEVDFINPVRCGIFGVRKFPNLFVVEADIGVRLTHGDDGEYSLEALVPATLIGRFEADRFVVTRMSVDTREFSPVKYPDWHEAVAA